jgi:predicted transcriptional regulator
MNPWILEEKTKRRDKLSIIAEILDIAKDGTLKTQIMYKANLSFAQLCEYLTFLINAKLLAKYTETGKEVYAATGKGIDFLQRHSELTELLNVNENGKNGVKMPPKPLLKRH